MTHDLTEQERTELALSIINLLNYWKIEPVSQINLLGLPEKTKPRALKRYQGGTPLPEDHDTLHRAVSFLRIHESLLITYPHNKAMGKIWLTTPNRRFQDKTPLSVMLEQGMDGIQQVRSHLDCTENWI
ncbi:MbcA/ParS/Xre antitoxin family protein [Candidatus Venteria ishoeyi]|uniref:Antitoxin Xre/MbcA/ParS-like toxin-binding domain-containing protein n=1 Tax=Candidatus Venteria ishoeyi TaxID=1899563 RepID=A0A1H6F7P9_9GAMM|nr:MbcA/ParS/Xre antitoxin family protein [Candidatus Venteria ishoeyi]MDM8547629.1 MbcA/ParS/Xre antitoxin family protein [Candidatus Venteria ishoeyi]SEH06158.1 Uncharacterised protein [Candidatus Venteria ishoeyi]